MHTGARPPDRLSAARDQLARAAEADNPGWAIRHGLFGWTATRARDARTVRSSSLPGLLALLSITDTAAPPPVP